MARVSNFLHLMPIELHALLEEIMVLEVKNHDMIYGIIKYINFLCIYIGEGHIFVLERDPSNNGKMKEVLVADYRDNLLDICWSESDPNILATAAGDGFAQVWNLGTRFPKVKY
jgi:hypothetical protein